MKDINLEERLAMVKQKHDLGYNCAQAVACSYCDLFGADEKEIFRAMEGFGAGMGVKSVCGAVSAMACIAGLSISGNLKDGKPTKGTTYKTVSKMTKEFEETCQSTICSELKGIETGVVLTDCQKCMDSAAKIIEKTFLTSQE